MSPRYRHGNLDIVFVLCFDLALFHPSLVILKFNAFGVGVLTFALLLEVCSLYFVLLLLAVKRHSQTGSVLNLLKPFGTFK